MIILALDTSCDDTSIAIVESKNKQIKILSSVVSSQIKIHNPYGGVYPMLAKREHQRNLALVCEKALKKAGLIKTNQKNDTKSDDRPTLYQNKIAKTLQRDGILLEKTITFLTKYEKPKINAIAITNGPGLEPCLWQGINFAKALSFYWGLPVIPVNHIKAHLAANFINKRKVSEGSPPGNLSPELWGGLPSDTFPAIGLVASGGHTELIYMSEIGKYKLIGSTRDDAAGECFDKTARILGLPYPGGPSLALQAKLKMKNEKLKIELPRPMLHSKDFNFSFSGLKTAVLYNFQSQKKSVKESDDYKIAMAKEIQQAIVDILIAKTLKAASTYKVKSIIAGGGVMANKELRKQFIYKLQTINYKLNLFVPPKNLCLDNAAMVGAEAILSQTKSVSWQKIRASGNMKI